MSHALPRIAITMGDPAGVGPEVCLHLLNQPEIRKICTPVVFGDAEILQQCSEQVGLPRPVRVIAEGDWSRALEALSELSLIHI